MKLTDLAALLRAAADRAESLALEHESGQQERAQARETGKRELVSGDVETLTNLVTEKPGLSTGEILGALRARGFSELRVNTALSAAILDGRIVTTKDGAKTLHYIRSES